MLIARNSRLLRAAVSFLPSTAECIFSSLLHGIFTRPHLVRQRVNLIALIYEPLEAAICPGGLLGVSPGNKTSLINDSQLGPQSYTFPPNLSLWKLASGHIYTKAQSTLSLTKVKRGPPPQKNVISASWRKKRDQHGKCREWSHEKQREMAGKTNDSRPRASTTM